MAKDSSIWTIVHAAVSGFMIFPILVAGVLTIFLARKREDPARIAFVWLKGCHPLLIVSLTCIITADIINAILYSWQTDSGSYDTAHHTHDAISNLIRSERYLSFTGNLFEHFVDVLFIVILVELGNGLMYSLDRQPSTYQRRLRYGAYSTAFVLLNFALAYFAQPAAAWMAYWNGSESNSAYAQLTQSLKTVGKLGACFYIPSWVVSMCQVGYASWVMHKHKAGVLTRHVAITYLVVAVLDFVRWTLFVILYCAWILPRQDNPWWWNLVDAVGNTWIRFAQLVMLLVIGMRRRKGIWTTHQPWMASSVSTTATTMTANTAAGPSPISAPGTVCQHALSPQKEYLPQSPMQASWYVPQHVSPWQHHDLASQLATPHPVIIAPRELDLMQYQYAPHPLLGPGYLVLQSTAQIQQYQQQFQLQMQQHQQQQQEQQQQQQQQQHQTYQSQQTQYDQQGQQSCQQHPQQCQLHHQPSFQFPQHHTV